MTLEAGKIFCSYARADAGFVLKLAKDMKSAGANIWLDQLDIPVGQRWDQAVEEALRGCEYLLVVLSPTSVESNNVMDEVSFGFEEQKQILPVLYRTCVIPFRLRRLQYSDFTASYDAGLLQLYQAVGMKAPEASRPGSQVAEAATPGIDAEESSGRSSRTPVSAGQSASRLRFSLMVAGALATGLVIVALAASSLFSGRSDRTDSGTAESSSRDLQLSPADTDTAHAQLTASGSSDSSEDPRSGVRVSPPRHEDPGCEYFDTRGVVTSFVDAKGYGFIRPSNGGEDVVVDQSVIRMEGFRTLAAGELVALDIAVGADGPQAKEVVKLEDSNHVRGSKARICLREQSQ